MLPFALNCVVAPDLRRELLKKPGCVGTEHRSDLLGTSFGRADPAIIGAMFVRASCVFWRGLLARHLRPGQTRSAHGPSLTVFCGPRRQGQTL